MKITEMELYRVKFPLFTPFTTALHSVDVKECIIVKLTSDEGLTGWGEAAPEIEITGDDADVAFGLLDGTLCDMVVGWKLTASEDFNGILLEMEPFIAESSCAVAAVDIALHDLWARVNKIPLYEHFGGTHRPLPTSLSIGIMDEEQLFQTIRELIGSGAKCIKLKIGDDAASDLGLIKKFRETFGYDIKLRLDANQGYNYSEAIDLFKKMEPFNIEFIEQPVPADDLSDLKLLHNESPIPVMADEAVRSYDSLVELAEQNACGRVNLKLMKSGGIFQVNKCIQFCSDNNIQCMIGCMIESPIGIAAGVHLALQGKAVKWTDLDGHLFLEGIGSVFTGLKTEKGENILTEEHGLGVDVNEGALSQYSF